MKKSSTKRYALSAAVALASSVAVASLEMTPVSHGETIMLDGLVIIKDGKFVDSVIKER